MEVGLFLGLFLACFGAFSDQYLVPPCDVMDHNVKTKKKCGNECIF